MNEADSKEYKIYLQLLEKPPGEIYISPEDGRKLYLIMDKRLHKIESETDLRIKSPQELRRFVQNYLLDLYTSMKRKTHK